MPPATFMWVTMSGGAGLAERRQRSSIGGEEMAVGRIDLHGDGAVQRVVSGVASATVICGRIDLVMRTPRSLSSAIEVPPRF